MNNDIILNIQDSNQYHSISKCPNLQNGYTELAKCLNSNNAKFAKSIFIFDRATLRQHC